MRLYTPSVLYGNSDLESIVKANEICDKLGMDTISAGNSIAFAMECYEKGLITIEESGGIDLSLGKEDSIIKLLKKIAYREGLGNVLAEGVRGASEKLGGRATKLAVHIKGLELPGYDPRGLKGVALAYAVSSRGACHLRHLAHRPNLTGLHPFENGKVNRLSHDAQAQLVADLEDFHAIVDSMVLRKFLCLPALGPIQWQELAELYRIITGVRAKKKDMISKGRNINKLIRHINNQLGGNRGSDCLPPKLTECPLKNGASKGEKIEKACFEKMPNEYYSCKKWTREGKPVRRRF